MRERPRVYLAGPEVFLPDAVEIGRRKREMCEERGLVGLYPLDNEVQGSPVSIYGGNRRFMDGADAIVANLTPFRGPSADVGTAFEVGYMAACDKPLFAYTNRRGSYRQRVARLAGLDAGAASHDPDGMAIEDFGLADNLMLEMAIRTSGGILVETSREHEDVRDALADLTAFRVCLDAAANLLAALG